MAKVNRRAIRASLSPELFAEDPNDNWLDETVEDEDLKEGYAMAAAAFDDDLNEDLTLEDVYEMSGYDGDYEDWLDDMYRVSDSDLDFDAWVEEQENHPEELLDWINTNEDDIMHDHDYGDDIYDDDEDVDDSDVEYYNDRDEYEDEDEDFEDDYSVDDSALESCDFKDSVTAGHRLRNKRSNTLHRSVRRSR